MKTERFQRSSLVVTSILNFMKSTAQEEEKQKKSPKIGFSNKIRYVYSVNGETF